MGYFLSFFINFIKLQCKYAAVLRWELELRLIIRHSRIASTLLVSIPNNNLRSYNICIKYFSVIKISSGCSNYSIAPKIKIKIQWNYFNLSRCSREKQSRYASRHVKKFARNCAYIILILKRKITLWENKVLNLNPTHQCNLPKVNCIVINDYRFLQTALFGFISNSIRYSVCGWFCLGVIARLRLEWCRSLRI